MDYCPWQFLLSLDCFWKFIRFGSAILPLELSSHISFTQLLRPVLSLKRVCIQSELTKEKRNCWTCSKTSTKATATLCLQVVWKELRDWKSNWKKIVFLRHWCSGIQPLYLIVKQISTFLGLFQSRQGTSSQYQYCYLDFVIWYCLSAQPIQYK